MIIEIWVRFIVMKTLMSFSDRLAYALKAKGARAVDLANALDISRPAVSLLLSGKNKGMRPEHLAGRAYRMVSDWRRKYATAPALRTATGVAGAHG